MREFKFRFYLRDMVYSNEYVDLADFFAEYVEECANTGKKISIMQYTGIKDINGKEIYEGDMLDCGDFIGKVEFNPSFCAFVITDGYEIKTFLDVGNEVKVIGNIYENPNLVEVEND